MHKYSGSLRIYPREIATVNSTNATTLTVTSPIDLQLNITHDNWLMEAVAIQCVRAI